MTLKSTFGRKQMPVPVDWHDSEWDLEVTIVEELRGVNGLQKSHRLHELHGIYEEERCEARMHQFGHLTLWRRSCKGGEVRASAAARKNRRLGSNGGNGWPTGMSALRGM